MIKKRKGIWIPIEILQNKELDFMNKVLLTEILSLSKLENGCTAALPHFGELIGTNPSAAGKRIKKLEKWGYIKCKNQYSGRRVIGRTIKVLNILGKSLIMTNDTSSDDDSVLEDVFPETQNDVSFGNDGITPTGHIDVSNNDQVMCPNNVSNGKPINTTTNSEIIIQEKIHYTNTVNNDNLTSTGKKSDTGTTNQLSSYNDINENGLHKMRNELIGATELGKNLFEFYLFGYNDRIIKCIGEEKFLELEPKLFEYKQLLFK